MSAIVKMPVTMTSLELVDFINDHRRQQGDDTVLRHDHFMAKVPKVLGEAAPKFVGTDLYANGTGGMIERDIYRFPKRESCLMAMSYSYALQALGRGAQHATIIAVEKVSGRRFGTQGFRPLKQWCKAHDVTPPKVPCPRYGEAVSWPAEAWREVYGVDLGELFGSERATVDGQLLGGKAA